MADDSLSVLSLNPKEDEQLTETAFAERTFFFPRPFWKIYADFLFDLHHFAAFGSKKQKCLRTGILRRKRQKNGTPDEIRTHDLLLRRQTQNGIF